jgi:opacity protein-like surface antigen
MKRSLAIFVALLVASSLVLSQVDSSQAVEVSAPLRHEVSVQGGLSIPYMPGAITDTIQTGWAGGIGYHLVFSPGELGYTAVSLNLDYNKFKAEGEVEANSFTAMVNFKGAFTKWMDPIAPYFSFGVGYMFFSSDSFKSDTTFDGGDHHAIGWNIAIGIEARITDQFTAYIQGQSVIGSLEKSRQYFPVCAGVRMRIF